MELELQACTYYGVHGSVINGKLFSSQASQASAPVSKAMKRWRSGMNIISSFPKLNNACAASQFASLTSRSVVRQTVGQNSCWERLSCGNVGAGQCRRCGIYATIRDASLTILEEYKDEQDLVKAGGSELEFVQMQALKNLQQVNILDRLDPLDGAEQVLDLVVIGCGPAGLSLASEAGKCGLDVGIIGPDLPFTNNYGVWKDEFAALGFENCIEHVWKQIAVYLDSNEPILINRPYCRVSRHLLREELLKRCAEAGVKYMDSKVERIVEEDEKGSIISCGNGVHVSCRLVTAASGAASGRFLNYEQGAPGVCVQTAYGVEIEVENNPFNPETMVFMDFRNIKRQEWESEATIVDEPPTFLYVMPFSATRIFVEETCLASRPAMPFSLLKERLYMRLKMMGVSVIGVYEEEWSYIPVGGSLPNTMQQHLGFGAAASMVHPATGYSVVRSLSEAPSYAAAIASALRSEMNKTTFLGPSFSSKDAAQKAWDALWPQEKKKQRAFFLFGLELILQLDLNGMRMFFETFFYLPEWMWKGFLAARLSSLELIWFSMITFLFAPNVLRYRLVRHLMEDPSTVYMIRTYAGLI